MVKLMSEVKVVRRWTLRTETVEAEGVDRPGSGPLLPLHAVARRVEAVLIGASTGGPIPLRTILAALPPDFPSAVLIVQHIAAGFVASFAEWLAQASRLPVHIAVDGESIIAGQVYIAPDGTHLGVGKGLCIMLDSGDPENGLRPSVAHLFRSAGKAYGRGAIGVILSGMGRDGAEELKNLKDLGAVTFAQDKSSSLVYGMPGEAEKLGGASFLMPPEEIAAAIIRLVGSENRARA